MPSSLPRNILKLTVALLKHQAELWLGEEAVGIAGETLVEIGGEELQEKIDRLIAGEEGAKELLAAAQRADAYFRTHCQDPALKGALSLSYGDLPSVQKALGKLAKAMDISDVRGELAKALQRDFPKLTQEQIESGATLYTESLMRALSSLKDFTLPVIRQVVFDIQQKVNELGLDHNEIRATLERIEKQILGQITPPKEIETPLGGLPPGSYIPFPRNALFTGREEELKNLGALCEPGDSNNFVISQAITGMGGVGKTQLAVEFAYRYGHCFKGVHWLDLRNPDTLDASIALCGTHMGLAYTDQREQVANTLQIWKIDGPRLLILDNFEDVTKSVSVLSRFQHPVLRLLITSRRRDFSKSAGLQTQALDTFSEAESLEFLERTLEREETEKGKKALAEKLGHLPLALELAASYINVNGWNITGYLEELENVLSHESMQDEWFRELEITNPTEHEQSLLATFKLSWEEVKNETAQKVFMLAGYCAPNTPIRREIFEKALDIAEKDITKAIYRLNGLGMLIDSDGLPTIHPLLATYARTLQTVPKDLLEPLANELARLAKQANDQMNQTGSLAWFAPLRQHTFIVADFAEKEGIQDAAYLLGNLGYYLRRIADFSGAKLADERAIRILEANLGKNDPIVATLVNNLGLVLQALGDHAGAKAAYERAIKIGETAFGPDHPQVATFVNNLGGVLQALGDHAGAKAAYERALKIFRQFLPEGHPSIKVVEGNLRSLENK